MSFFLKQLGVYRIENLANKKVLFHSDINKWEIWGSEVLLERENINVDVAILFRR